jgi:hypothetical protein
MGEPDDLVSITIDQEVPDHIQSHHGRIIVRAVTTFIEANRLVNIDAFGDTVHIVQLSCVGLDQTFQLC